MITACELAGFFAAHAVWSVSDGETLVPMLAYKGKRSMERLVGEELSAVVARAKERLANNPMDANDGVLLYDGLITLEGKKVDAIIIESRAYFSPQSTAGLAVPYTPKTAVGGFKVHRPKLLAWSHCEGFDQRAAPEAFFNGVDAHAQSAKVWNNALDQSK
jgi:hypothetical protein